MSDQPSNTNILTSRDQDESLTTKPLRTDYSNLAPDDAGALGEQLRLKIIKGARPEPEPDEAC